MKKFGIGLAVLALVMGFGLAAMAGGNGAVKTDLWEATPRPPNGFPQPSGDVVGFVVFNTSKKAIEVTVVLADGEPNESWTVQLVPRRGAPQWTAEGTLTTNGQGKGTLHLSNDMPDGWEADVIRAKISMYPQDGGTVYYATYMQTEIPVK